MKREDIDSCHCSLCCSCILSTAFLSSSLRRVSLVLFQCLRVFEEEQNETNIPPLSQCASSLLRSLSFRPLFLRLLLPPPSAVRVCSQRIRTKKTKAPLRVSPNGPVPHSATSKALRARSHLPLRTESTKVSSTNVSAQKTEIRGGAHKRPLLH